MAWHKECRLVRRHILSKSKDPQVLAIHEAISKEQHNSKSNAWKDCVELKKLNDVALFEKMRGPLKEGRSGLGWGSRRVIRKSPEKSEREAILRIFREITEEERVTHVVTNLQHFGEWVKWKAVMQVDRKWHDLLSYRSDSQLRFRICATEDVLPTPSVLACLRQEGESGMCPHGCGVRATLRHILCECRIKEEPQSRITWRHDSVLLAIFKAVLAVVNRFKNATQKSKRTLAQSQPAAIMFKSEKGTKYTAARAQVEKGLLERAVDWKILFDLDHPESNQTKGRMFPSEILEVSKRPDGVIWSPSTKIVIWIELTSPWEENMETWHFQKKSNYNELAIDCRAQGWEVHPLCVEVGCRGDVSPSFHYMCKVLGFTSEENKTLKKNAEEAVLSLT